MKKFSDIDISEIGHTKQFIGCAYAGKDGGYLFLFPGEKKVELEDVEMSSGDCARLLRQTDLMETEVVQRAIDGTTTKAMLRKSNRQISQVVQWNVFRRDGYRCRYCGRNDVPLTVDHLITWEDSGPSTEDNLFSSCRPCNRARGNVAYEQWLCSSYYQSRSKDLDPTTKASNAAKSADLDKIQRVVHVQSR